MRLCFAFLFVLLSSALYGQEQGFDSDHAADSLHIEEVVVELSRTRREVIPVQILSGKNLEALSAHSVADAVRYFSGVQIKDYGGVGGLKTIDVRSLGSHHVGVFYDGVELGNAQNGVVDLGRFSLDNMESVSMYNGQKSAIFQSAKDYASASAIYLTTRKPSFSPEKSYNVNIGVKGGSFQTINPSLLWEQKISSSLRSSLSAEYLYTSGEYPFSYSKANGYDTTEVRKNGDVRYLRAEAALFGDIDHGQWQAKAYYYNSERGYPGAVVREEPGVFKNADRQWDENFFAQGLFRKSFSSSYNLKVSAKYSHDYLRYLSDPSLDSSTMYADNSYIQQEVYGSVANLFTLSPRLAAALSSDLQYNTLWADLTSFVYPERLTSLSAVALSGDFDRIKMQGSLLYSFVRDEVQQGDDSADNLNAWTPTLVLNFDPFGSDNLSLRAFYKRVFRMPTLNDLYYTLVGSVDLNPEYTTQYNFGATYKAAPTSKALTYLELKADCYFNQVEDKIIAMPTSNQFRWTMINLGYVEIRGVDTALDMAWSLSKVALTTRLSYTYQQAQDFTDAESDYYGGQIPYIPWHSGSLIVGVQWDAWSLNYSFLYTGERYESVANIPENYAQPWYTSDFSISRSLLIRGLDMRLTAEVNNIMNQQYEVVQCYPMPGRNYKIKINVNL